jgi:hypothetical protein
VALPWLRGRAGVAAPAQAAQHLVREKLALLGVDALPPLSVERLTGAGADVERFTVTLDGPDGPVGVTVESRPSEQAVRLTCRAVHPAHQRTWHLLAMTDGTAPAGR